MLPNLEKRRTGVRRVGWAGASQLLSSGTNFLAGVYAANVLSPTEFGLFGLSLAVYTIAQGLVRAALGEALLTDGSRGSKAAPVAGLLSILVGVTGGLLCAVFSQIAPSPLAEATWQLTPWIPGLLGLELVRQFAFGSGNPRLVAALDGTWLLGLGLGILLIADGVGPSKPLVAWGLAASVAFAASLIWVRPVLGRPSELVQWLTDTRHLALPYTIEFMGSIVSGPGVALVLGVGFSAATVAGFRGSQLLLGPISIIYATAGAVFVPWASKRFALGQDIRNVLITISVLMTSAAVLASAFWIVDPLSLAPDLLGASWSAARAFLPAVAAITISNALGAAGLLYLRAGQLARRIAAVRWLSAALNGLALMLGLVLGTGEATALLLALASAATTLLWLYSARSSARSEKGGQA